MILKALCAVFQQFWSAKKAYWYLFALGEQKIVMNNADKAVKFKDYSN